MHTFRNLADGYIICNFLGLIFVYMMHKDSTVTPQPAQPASITVRNRVNCKVWHPRSVSKTHNKRI
jgi:hypothetical protein